MIKQVDFDADQVDVFIGHLSATATTTVPIIATKQTVLPVSKNNYRQTAYGIQSRQSRKRRHTR